MNGIILILLTLILLIFILISIFSANRIKNYVLIFNIWWLFWLVISYINIGEFYQRALKTYIYIYSGIIMFNLSIFFPVKNLKKISTYLNKKKLKILMFIEISFVVVNIFYLIKMMVMIKSLDNYWMVRLIFYGIEFAENHLKLFSSSIEALVYYFLKTISVTSFLVGLSLWRKNSKFFLIISFFNILLYCLLSGSREFVSYLMIIGIFSFKTKTLKKNMKVILLLVFFTFLMTFLREGNLKKIMMTLITYYSGAIAYLDYLIKNDNGKFYNGELLFTSIIGPIKFLFRYVGFNLSNNAITEVGENLMKLIQISDRNPFFKYYNALATAFYWQYKDFGYLGIIIINFILGVFHKIFYKKLIAQSMNHIVIISYLEYLMLQSIFSFKHIDIFSILPLIFYLYILKGKKC